jgi:hypothetical protein
VIRTGRQGLYNWLVVPTSSTSLVEWTIRFHPGLRLCITAFDGGSISPSPEELAEGWITRGKVLVSPPLAEGLHIPLDQYDEWYLLAEPPPSAWEPEVFVNYGGFTLESVDEIYKTFDPTWDRRGLDYLVPIQERFWSQPERISPVSYIAMGDQDVVVTQIPEFTELLKATV